MAAGINHSDKLEYFWSNLFCSPLCSRGSCCQGPLANLDRDVHDLAEAPARRLPNRALRHIPKQLGGLRGALLRLGKALVRPASRAEAPAQIVLERRENEDDGRAD